MQSRSKLQSQLDPGYMSGLPLPPNCPSAPLPVGCKWQCHPFLLMEPQGTLHSCLYLALSCALSTLTRAQAVPHLTGEEKALRNRRQHLPGCLAPEIPKSPCAPSPEHTGVAPGDPEKNRVHRASSCTTNTTSQLKATSSLSKKL